MLQETSILKEIMESKNVSCLKVMIVSEIFMAKLIIILLENDDCTVKCIFLVEVTFNF
ncbi:hypothetical protein MHTCC0001_31510 [Flavobacteriaceae bacterium MHTCC 0001]